MILKIWEHLVNIMVDLTTWFVCHVDEVTNIKMAHDVIFNNPHIIAKCGCNPLVPIH
jgi:hypothetical protein